MRVAVVFFRSLGGERIIELGKKVSQGIESQGHIVDVIDGDKDHDKRLTSYQYIVIGTSSTTLFGGKIPDNVKKYIANAGMVQGKRCSAFIYKTGIRCEKTLLRLMKVMESEGMYLKNSEIFKSPAAAEYFGKRLHLDQKLV